MKENHIGSSFEDFLREEGICEETTAAAMKRVLARQTAREIEKSTESRTKSLA